MENIFAGKTILVTGGTGSIGKEIVNQVLQYDINKVVVFSRDEIKHFVLKNLIVDSRLDTFVGDVRDPSSLARLFDRYNFDIIYHAAAMKHVVVCENHPHECAYTNIFGTQNVIDAAIRNEVPKLVTISTDKASSPVNVMGCTKYIAETITLNANYSCVRFGNVANSRGSVIPIFLDCLVNGTPLTLTDPEVTRFVFKIPDAVKLVLSATKYSSGGDLFILKMKAFKLGDLLDVLVNKIVPRLGIDKEQIIINKIGLLPGEKLHEDLLNESELSRVYEMQDMYVVLKEHESSSRSDLAEINLMSYTSSDVELISKDELESFILDYLRNK
ncbi:SDR family NAD(P)-dependent oxidoreductase [Methanococcoides methylutens]|uniref:UDP-N-acetylglucosamine 4,6-dehydratase n=1 Tax=Methanococcoides methylutens MM1 TaxID=1434104 RepID=A0A0E3SP12_METMT|nr:SDR family NAD(P)-dependent oxidoreductase [Methanococcoides methylutens]AKB84296.1 UDP-N-acetylglucosamine 4,6-dehydratase [Methanococcoides methylutens MM1]